MGQEYRADDMPGDHTGTPEGGNNAGGGAPEGDRGIGGAGGAMEGGGAGIGGAQGAPGRTGASATAGDRANVHGDAPPTLHPRSGTPVAQPVPGGGIGGVKATGAHRDAPGTGEGVRSPTTEDLDGGTGGGGSGASEHGGLSADGGAQRSHLDEGGQATR